MTPHIIRIPDITEDDVAPMWVGTTNNLTFRGVTPRIESQSSIDPFTVRQQPGQSGIDRQGNPVYVTPGLETTAPASPPSTSRPGFTPPQGGGPTDVFRDSQPPPPPPPNPQGRIDDDSARLMASTNAAPAESDLRFAPRIAPQPATLSIRPGEQKYWAVVGMDLDGLHTDGLVIRFDANALEVIDVSFGPALAIDPKTPPVVKIDRGNGVVRVTSSDGKPLTFRSGGELLMLRVQGGITGSTSLVFASPELKNARNEIVVAAVTGGRAQIE